MAKSFIILSTVLLISAAFADDAATELAAAKEECVKSIEEALKDGHDMYDRFSLWNVSAAMREVYDKGTSDLIALREEVDRATTMEVTTEVESGFRKRIQCSDDIAQRVRSITIAMYDGLIDAIRRTD